MRCMHSGACPLDAIDARPLNALRCAGLHLVDMLASTASTTTRWLWTGRPWRCSLAVITGTVVVVGRLRCATCSSSSGRRRPAETGIARPWLAWLAWAGPASRSLLRLAGACAHLSPLCTPRRAQPRPPRSTTRCPRPSTTSPPPADLLSSRPRPGRRFLAAPHPSSCIYRPPSIVVESAAVNGRRAHTPSCMPLSFFLPFFPSFSSSLHPPFHVIEPLC